MNTSVVSHPKLGITILLAAAMLAQPLQLAAAESRPTTPVTVENPVSIAGTVNVQGVVEVLNDVLRTPFVQSASASSDSPTVTFDVPDGKRLVIQTIAFQASRPTADANRMFFEPLIDSSRHLVPLPVQFTSVEGAVSYMISMISLSARIDSVPGNTTELRFRRGTGAVGSLNVTVFGYLVDI